MKNILFPTDFSPAAESAFIYALKVAEKLQATITTLHVYQLPDIHGVHLPPSLQEVYDSLNLEAFENHRDFIPRLRQIAAENNMERVDLKHALQEGEPIPSILRYARELESDFIIMGTKGATGLREILFGSVTAEVMENAECPVLAVPREAVFEGSLRNIAMITSFTDKEKKALRWLLSFADLFGAQVFVANAETANKEYYKTQIALLQEEFEDVKGLFFTEMSGDYFQEPLSLFLEEKGMDLLATLTHKRSFIEELFNYSLSKQMAYHSKIPILTIQEHTLNKMAQP
jgi:nucleotide-binding universal stress UspA family protein